MAEPTTPRDSCCPPPACPNAPRKPARPPAARECPPAARECPPAPHKFQPTLRRCLPTLRRCQPTLRKCPPAPRKSDWRVEVREAMLASIRRIVEASPLHPPPTLAADLAVSLEQAIFEAARTRIEYLIPTAPHLRKFALA